MTRARHLIGLIAVAVLAAACGGSKGAPQNQSTPAATQATQAAQPNQKRYQLKGKILAVKADANALTIDGQDIPGFMSAMTMDYTVKSKDSLSGLKAGDEITGDIVVPEGGTAYLENIVVTKKGG